MRMKLQVQVADAGDKIDDPSIAWPDSRKTVELGEIEIDKAARPVVHADRRACRH